MSVYTTDARLAYRRVTWFWAVTVIPAAVVSVLFQNYFFIYLTDVLLVAPVAVGALLAFARIYDGVTDLALAAWSDRSKSRFGRRKPFIIAGGLGLVLYGAVWLPPENLSAAGTIIWLGLLLLVYETASTLRNVPMLALGVELGQTPERRSWFYVIGLIVGLPFAIAANFVIQDLINSPDARAAGAPWFIGAGIALAAATVGMGLFLKELPAEHKTVERNVWRMMREVLGVGYHRRIIGVQLAETFAFTSLAFSVPYLMTYVLDRPDRIAIIFIAYLVVSIVAQPGWLALIPRLGMKRIWTIGLYMWLAAFVAAPLSLLFGYPFFFGLVIWGGLAGGAATVNYAMLGDIADYDARQSGRQRQGVYMTIYSLVAKIGGAAVAFLLGIGLQASGFVPNAEQSTMVVAAIVMSGSLIPFLGVLLGIRWLRGYDFYEREGLSDGRREFIEEGTLGDTNMRPAAA